MKQCTCYALRAVDCTCKPAKYGELYTSPTAKQEQGELVGYLEIDDIESQREYPHNCRNVNLWYEGGEGLVAIYTTPYVATQRQQRPFIKPLTDEQIDQIMRPLTTKPYSWREFARAIEAAHGIKGEA